MISFIINAIKIIFLLGFLIIIHEGGHFIVAKFCKVKVNEFAIGFGKAIWQKQGKETKYSLRLIPLGGFCSMEGEDEESDAEGSFSRASVWKRMAIVVAGATVNILFGILVYFILVSTVGIQFLDPAKDTFLNRIYYGAKGTGEFIATIFDSIKMLFTGGLKTDQMVGIVGISDIVSKSEIMNDNIAISVYDKDDENGNIIAAKAADELLTIGGITASFVLAKMNNVIYISGRSIGEINVQIILEKLGGGGHITLAGAQVENMTLEEAKQELINRINEYFFEQEQ